MTREEAFVAAYRHAIEGAPLRFCWTCGSPMRLKVKLDMFSSRTGEPIFDRVYTCPNDRWWRTGHYSMSDD